jgi:hypothetical protein
MSSFFLAIEWPKVVGAERSRCTNFYPPRHFGLPRGKQRSKEFLDLIERASEKSKTTLDVVA